MPTGYKGGFDATDFDDIPDEEESLPDCPLCGGSDVKQASYDEGNPMAENPAARTFPSWAFSCNFCEETWVVT